MIHDRALMIHCGKQNRHVHKQICTFIVVERSLLHISATDCGHFQGCSLKDILLRKQNYLQI